jgi:hypothetical protein
MIHVSRDGSYYAVMVYPPERGKLLRIEKGTGDWDAIDFLCSRVAGCREYFGASIDRGVCLLAWAGNVLLSCAYLQVTRAMAESDLTNDF